MEKLVSHSPFWQGKKVLVTGHTGFKGSWLALWLQQLGAHVVGLSLAPTTSPNLFDVADVADDMTSIIGDIRDLTLVNHVFQQCQPDIVIHLAAQALVRYSYVDPIETYQTNVMGTLNILEALRSFDGVKAAIMVTTDKCYDNKEQHRPYQETDALGGHDPYSSSKACAELLIDSYRRSFFTEKSSTAIASVRAGNVIGGGDWSVDRLIPDIVAAAKSNQTLNIRYPAAIRPWQHVLEPLHGYLSLAEKLFNHGRDYAQAWNFGPMSEGEQSVSWIADYFAQRWSSFTWFSNGEAYSHEANILKLDCSKARDHLAWAPSWSLEEALEQIEKWYMRFDNDDNMKQVCLEQIALFANSADIKAT